MLQSGIAGEDSHVAAATECWVENLGDGFFEIGF